MRPTCYRGPWSPNYFSGPRGGRIGDPFRPVRTSSRAYDRDDVRATVAHRAAPMAGTWLAQSGFPPRRPCRPRLLWRDSRSKLFAKAVMLRSMIDEAFVRVERVQLRDVTGKELSFRTYWAWGIIPLSTVSEDALITERGCSATRLPGVRRPGAISRRDTLVVPGALTAVVWCLCKWRNTRTGALSCARRFADGLLRAGRYGLSQVGEHIDRQKTPLLRADTLFRAVSLVPGEPRSASAPSPDQAYSVGRDDSLNACISVCEAGLASALTTEVRGAALVLLLGL